MEYKVEGFCLFACLLFNIILQKLFKLQSTVSYKWCSSTLALVYVCRHSFSS